MFLNSSSTQNIRKIVCTITPTIYPPLSKSFLLIHLSLLFVLLFVFLRFFGYLTYNLHTYIINFLFTQKDKSETRICDKCMYFSKQKTNADDDGL